MSIDPISEGAMPSVDPSTASATPTEQPSVAPEVTQDTAPPAPTVTNARVPKRRDIVDFVLPSGHHAGEKRPAVILKVWGDTPDSLVNLLIFTDSVNDFITAEPAGSGIWWRTSVERDDSGEKPGTYNFGE